MIDATPGITGLAVAGRPLAVRAQQPALRVIGFLTSQAQSGTADFVAAFRGNLLICYQMRLELPVCARAVHRV